MASARTSPSSLGGVEQPLQRRASSGRGRRFTAGSTRRAAIASARTSSPTARSEWSQRKAVSAAQGPASPASAASASAITSSSRSITSAAQQLVLGGELAVEAADPDPGGRGERRHRRVEAVAGEDLVADRQQPRPFGGGVERPPSGCTWRPSLGRNGHSATSNARWPPPSPERTHPNVTLAVLALGGLAYAMLSSLVVPALPTMQHDLGTTETGITWLLTGYLLAASVGTSILGRLGDMYGKERLLLWTL